MSGSANSDLSDQVGGPRPGAGGFSLLELLVVLAIIVTVLGMTSLGLQGLSRDRQGSLAEVRGVLETARGTALARKTDVYVAFAASTPRQEEDRYSRWALFVPADDAAGNLFERELRAISEWFALPEGILFAVGAEFETATGEPFATILDAPEAFVREFDFGPDHDAVGARSMQRMPFFLFNARGMLEVPPVFGEKFHHVGVVEAAYEQGQSSMGVADRIHLGWQEDGAGKRPRTACLAVDAATGRSRILSD